MKTKATIISSALSLSLALCSCQDDTLPIDSGLSAPAEKTAAAASADGDRQEYWFTRSRSAQMEQTMIRCHGVGFSCDAVNGEKCGMADVRCQILDTDYLATVNSYHSKALNKSNANILTARNRPEYESIMNSGMETSGGILLYKGRRLKTSALLEKGDAEQVTFITKYDFRNGRKTITTSRLLNERHKDILEKALSENFRFALNRIEAASKDNVAVVDSFINIFGTHVIVDATTGGRLTMEINTDATHFKTYASEKRVSENSFNFFFAKTTSSTTDTDIRHMEGTLRNSHITIDVKGGDGMIVSSVISRPDPANAVANGKALADWENSIGKSTDEPWTTRSAMIDSKVMPIWEFVPNPETALRIKTRIQANPDNMRQLYGDRNYVPISFSLNPGAVTTTLGGKAVTTSDPWVVDVVAANRKVATICKEWVPEISQTQSVRVAYPIYNNRLRMESGVCIHNGKAYTVKWLYDRFVVEEMTEADGKYVHPDGNTLYLNCGRLEIAPSEALRYQACRMTLGYEWPGSIRVDGELSGSQSFETRKFLNRFYLTTTEKFANLPNWSYRKADAGDGVSQYMKDKYADLLQGKNAAANPYALSGMDTADRKGADNLTNRMVRNADYTYYINTAEMALR